MTAAAGAYPDAGPGLPSEWGWRAAEPQRHNVRVLSREPYREETFDARTEHEIDYEVLRDTVIAAFNPPDGDGAEISIVAESVDRAWAFIAAQPCTCPAGTVPKWIDPHEATITDYFGLWCARCVALGRSNDRRLER